MEKKRKPIPKKTEKRLYQETNSACAFCRENEISALVVHHIDGDPSNNDPDNLIVVCGNCHGKITDNIIRLEDVQLQKRVLKTGLYKAVKTSGDTINIKNSHIKGDVAHTINKYSIPKKAKIQHPEGSIGANIKMKGYIDYLIKRYYEYGKADTSYGRKRAFNHGVIHRNIESKFGYKTFFMPDSMFEELAEYLKERIDKTIQGKGNRSRGKANYHSFYEHPKRD